MQFSERFDEDVVSIARQRLGSEDEAFSPTADSAELDLRTRQLLSRPHLSLPSGSLQPERVEVGSVAFKRDPYVKAYILRQAKGRCEACSAPAPFKTAAEMDFLEVHHMKPLANGGSDRVQNAVALCPNCHRALHHAADAEERSLLLYKRIGRLIPE
ncbi:HNH endonuclease [Amorphus sp. MBR-141]